MADNGFVVRCPCGQVMRADGPDEMVAAVQEHSSQVHDGLPVRREDVLAMMVPASQFRPPDKSSTA